METESPRELSKEEMAREAVREHLRRAGRKGGETMKKRGRAYYQEIGRKGAKSRWKTKE